jgi:hypothetical protein
VVMVLLLFVRLPWLEKIFMPTIPVVQPTSVVVQPTGRAALSLAIPPLALQPQVEVRS